MSSKSTTIGPGGGIAAAVTGLDLIAGPATPCVVVPLEQAMSISPAVVTSAGSSRNKKASRDQSQAQNEFYLLFRRIALAMKKAKRCIAVTGAGISVSAGIPDFRSEDGLYKIAETVPSDCRQREDLFDVTLFRDITSTKIFYEFMAQLKVMVDSAQATPTHHFLSQLHTRGKLNIDCLEVVQAKTNLKKTAKLPKDAKSLVKDEEITSSSDDMPSLSAFALSEEPSSPTSDMTPSLSDGSSSTPQPAPPTPRCPPVVVKLHGDLSRAPPTCPSCVDQRMLRSALGKREIAVGTLRPNVVLYGRIIEVAVKLPPTLEPILKKSLDLLLVIGTSLSVDGAKRLVKDIAKAAIQWEWMPAKARAKAEIPTPITAAAAFPGEKQIIGQRGKPAGVAGAKISQKPVTGKGTSSLAKKPPSKVLKKSTAKTKSKASAATKKKATVKRKEKPLSIAEGEALVKAAVAAQDAFEGTAPFLSSISMESLETVTATQSTSTLGLSTTPCLPIPKIRLPAHLFFAYAKGKRKSEDESLALSPGTEKRPRLNMSQNVTPTLFSAHPAGGISVTTLARPPPSPSEPVPKQASVTNFFKISKSDIDVETDPVRVRSLPDRIDRKRDT
ncbi:DHS-like NAD/FAD-binding domain-containing protein [Chytridium lagenaria]|nr:DHS-like NAD/FAD-binding domain-containing protein [Chytridium lagenaria]